MNDLVIGIAIFLLTFIAIASEKIHKTIAALIGASLMLLLKIVEQHKAFHEIDLNVIFLLIGMMVIVHITSQTGVFQWIAIQIAKTAKGKPVLIIILLSIITAILSAFLDNVTTVILLAPVCLLICQQLEIDPIPFLILIAVSSNIGGTATSIGDPPNILISSAAGLSFLDFIINLAPVIIVIMLAFIYTVKFMFKDKMNVSSELRARIMSMDPTRVIKNKKLLIQCLSVMSYVFIGFFIHGALHLEPATIALSGAAILILITKTDPEEIFKHIEWGTIFFFIGLFIIVAGVIEIGVIAIISEKLLSFFGEKLIALNMFILWFSAISSALVDNIPFVATVIPIIKETGQHISLNMNVPPGDILNPLWWSLALGSCLGGNGSLIGASANVIVAGIAKKNNHIITFLEFSKYGILFLIQSLIISTAYLYLRYMMFSPLFN